VTDPLKQRCPGCGAYNRVPRARLADSPKCGKCHAPIFSAAPVVATDASFADLVENCAIPVLVDFWAPWCGPCRAMEPTLEAAASQRAGRVRVAKVNIDENPALAQRFGIRSIPALKLFRGAKVVDEINGAVPAGALGQFLDRHAD
jgi:thioredoxin 2